MGCIQTPSAGRDDQVRQKPTVVNQESAPTPASIEIAIQLCESRKNTNSNSEPVPNNNNTNNFPDVNSDDNCNDMDDKYPNKIDINAETATSISPRHHHQSHASTSGLSNTLGFGSITKLSPRSISGPMTPILSNDTDNQNMISITSIDTSSHQQDLDPSHLPTPSSPTSPSSSSHSDSVTKPSPCTYQHPDAMADKYDKLMGHAANAGIIPALHAGPSQTENSTSVRSITQLSKSDFDDYVVRSDPTDHRSNAYTYAAVYSDRPESATFKSKTVLSRLSDESK